MTSPPPDRDALAARAWQTMFAILIRSAPRRTAALARRGLTPNDSRALFSLHPHEGRTMRSLAVEWKCDPSNATWIVDHLEELELAERRSLPKDRRVKLVVLTPKGRRTRTSLLREFHHPPPEFAALDRPDLETLDRVLEKLTAAGAASTGGAGSDPGPPKGADRSRLPATAPALESTWGAARPRATGARRTPRQFK